MTINKRLCPKGLSNNPNKDMQAIKFITIHTTGNSSPTASAIAHANYQLSGSGGRQASWHYTVDATEIWQSFEDNRMCWHAGDGNGLGNASSIGIEICINHRGGFNDACDRAAWLTAELLKRHQLTVDKVVQHFHWSGKNCPAELRSGAWGTSWMDFLGFVAGYHSMNHCGNVEKGGASGRPTPEQIFSGLSRKVLISSPEYWINALNGKQQVNSDYLYVLLARLAGFDI